VELGVYTFTELTPEVDGGPAVDAERRLRDLIEEIELADQVGLDVFGVGEHHRPDFAVSAPAVALAAAAERIRLTSRPSQLTSVEARTASSSSSFSANSRRLEGANFVGSPAEVAAKILHQHAIFDHDRFLIQFSVGTLPHADVMRSIELFGTEVAPWSAAS
jgi:alkanesulfonate monooxygenase SsuD/methylene tetrahydromethanopterin reductase-like flavin-dependent oxidoreductase (luciferase family)